MSSSAHLGWSPPSGWRLLTWPTNIDAPLNQVDIAKPLQCHVIQYHIHICYVTITTTNMNTIYVYTYTIHDHYWCSLDISTMYSTIQNHYPFSRGEPKQGALFGAQSLALFRALFYSPNSVRLTPLFECCSQTFAPFPSCWTTTHSPIHSREWKVTSDDADYQTEKTIKDNPLWESTNSKDCFLKTV